MNLIKIHKDNKRLKSFQIDENILNLIEKEKGNILCTADIDLFISYNPYLYNWHKYAEGTICLIKDLNIKSYFFKLFNSIPFLLWQHQIKSNKIYIKLNENFYYFTTQDFNFGFKFSDCEQASNLFEIVNQIEMQKRKDGNFNSISNRLLKKTPPKKKSSITNAISMFKQDKPSKNESIEELLQKLEIKSNRKRLEYLKQFIAKNGGLQFINKEVDIYASKLFYDSYYKTGNRTNSDSLNNLLDISIETFNLNSNDTNNDLDLIQLNDLNCDMDSVSMQNFCDQSDCSSETESKQNTSRNDMCFIDKLKFDLLALSDIDAFESDTD